MGAMLSLWPDVTTEVVTAFSYVRAAAGAATSIMFAILLALAPSYAYSGGPAAGSPAGMGSAAFVDASPSVEAPVTP